ncbi:MAG: DNA modification methylase [Natronomonas sp.]|jgi:DNA modification methylase
MGQEQEPTVADIFDDKQSSLSTWTDGNDAESDVQVDTLIGTFNDNTDAPIHRWFRYQAGFSYELVSSFLDLFDIGEGDEVLDPFGGVGTTVVEAKKKGATAHGVEVHPFVSWVAERKTDWDVDVAELQAEKTELQDRVGSAIEERNYHDYIDDDGEPEFLYKVFDDRKLGELYIIDDVLKEYDSDYSELYRMALVASLREVCKANTVFPYVQPSATKDSTPEPQTVFSDKLSMVIDDLNTTLRETDVVGDSTIHDIDARDIDTIEDESIDTVITSPPYLNNVDYADVTRLELYFLGYASTWGEVTDEVRTDLVNSSTVVLKGVPSDVSPRPELPETLREEIEEIQSDIRDVRDEKDYSGKRYDVMVAAYFNDMYDVISSVYDKMKPGTHFVMVLGDSAPYGVHVPTDLYLGRVAEHVGFEFSDVYEIRERGDTWQSIKGSRRHEVDLRESIVLLKKPE